MLEIVLLIVQILMLFSIWVGIIILLGFGAIVNEYIKLRKLLVIEDKLGLESTMKEWRESFEEWKKQ